MKNQRKSYYKDLTGQSFQDYTVIEFAERLGKDGAYTYMWLCECVCGNRRLVAHSNLKNPKTKGCGCKSCRGADITGQVSGEYTAIEPSYKKNSYWFWKVQHSNGDIKYMSVPNFKAKSKYIPKNQGE